MLKIGITGGIGSGKSVVAGVFGHLGVPVFYADAEAKVILDSDESVKARIAAELGKEFIDDHGNVLKSRLAGRVFEDPAALKRLNNIIHPHVNEAFEKWISQKQEAYVIKEAAILFESGAHRYLDSVILVCCPEELRIVRVMKRDRLSEKEIRRRVANQMSDEEKKKLAEYAIVNDGITPVIPQVLALHKIFSKT